MRSHEQKREAVPKHSLPPQEQIFTYWGRFTNCPYETPENGTLFFSAPRYDIMTKIHRVIGAHGEKTLKNQGLQLPVDKFDSALSFPQPRNRL